LLTAFQLPCRGWSASGTRAECPGAALVFLKIRPVGWATTSTVLADF
jgi:hypothetical protein